MKRSSYFLLFICVISLWGCPTKKQIPQPPAPKPTEPQVTDPQAAPGKPQTNLHSQKIYLAYDWLDVVEILKGAAPLVGPTPYFFRMMA